jgi:hypothetical protein
MPARCSSSCVSVPGSRSDRVLKVPLMLAPSLFATPRPSTDDLVVVVARRVFGVALVLGQVLAQLEPDHGVDALLDRELDVQRDRDRPAHLLVDDLHLHLVALDAALRSQLNEPATGRVLEVELTGDLGRGRGRAGEIRLGGRCRRRQRRCDRKQRDAQRQSRSRTPHPPSTLTPKGQDPKRATPARARPRGRAARPGSPAAPPARRAGRPRPRPRRTDPWKTPPRARRPERRRQPSRACAPSAS